MATAKSPLASPSSHLSQSRGGYSAAATPSASLGTATQQQQQGIVAADDDPTLANTLANSHLGATSPLADAHLTAPVPIRPAKFTEEWDASQRGSSIIEGGPANNMSSIQRSNSYSGSATGTETASQLPSRSNTLKKKASLRRGGSLKRSGSRRSMKAGSVRSLALQSATDEDEIHSAFFCPVPTTGNPTEALASRFQAWRKILKDLITYFKEIQAYYEHRSKSLLKLANVLNNVQTPAGFLASGGLDDALQVLRQYNKQAIVEANKGRDIEEDVVLALTGLRSDLQQKIKEIKNLSGDFKNSVEKEMEGTRRAVNALQEVLGQSDLDTSLTTGKQDPYLLRLAVDRQLEKQIDEENYLHQAYLNLENSGRELEAIVVGEIQKSYNAYAGILKRESDAAYSAIEDLRTGPIAMPKDHEWAAFVRKDEQFVDPEIPIRSAQFIHYPGRDHFASQEIRAGLLERKTKYLKSYTAGWYVLSPTHLHEFKSADKTQAPLMSLYLPEQKLGSHSSGGGSSNKFVLKGRQTGGMHRGHTWVFRAESHDTMMAWYEDIKALTEKSPQERSDFVRGHSRSFSRSSQRSFSSDGVVDEDDDEPYSAHNSAAAIKPQPQQDVLPRRPSPGGRFPSDIQVNAQRGLQAPLSPSSVSSGFDNQDREVIAAAGALPGSGVGQEPAGEKDGRFGYGSTAYTPMNEASSHAAIVSQEAQEDGVNPYTSQPIQQHGSTDFANAAAANSASGAGVGDATSNPANRTPHGYEDQQRNSYVVVNGESAYGQRRAPNSTSGNSSARNSFAAGDDAGFGVAATNLNGTTNSNASAFGQQPAKADPRVVPGPVLASHQQQVDGAAYYGGGKATRPTAGARTDSGAPTISNLHIPGEYPKATPLN
ncbi:putative ph domain-containing protein [Phaeoacremonium minimum UCRPA7]|uniref:Putative ph domain-containing protein n=1 Tax=Phaeoacremonium minimum (strain UCR-PA7) TaxID=1286976 RepID=R8BT07_PHAM7|nr:putative ph domain-containing protein [Phaeoacremonium minimum UCRPA7]EOO02533.1 putative ph domain-containing protein [Phaeoacremonium minimum UCRPA7]